MSEDSTVYAERSAHAHQLKIGTSKHGELIGRLEIEHRHVEHLGHFLQGMALFSRGAGI